MQGLLPGSVSKYCLQQSPIPVIVVRPSLKREKKKKKRLADPSRKSYNHILRMSQAKGSRLFDNPKSADSSSTTLHEDEEAQAVAKAIGLTSSSQAGDAPSRPLSKDSSSGKGASDNEEDDSTRRTSGSSVVASNPLMSPTSDASSVAVKSPSLHPLDSPAVTDSEGEQSEDDESHNPQPRDTHDDDGPVDGSKPPTAGEGSSVPSPADRKESATTSSMSTAEILPEKKSKEAPEAVSACRTF